MTAADGSFSTSFIGSASGSATFAASLGPATIAFPTPFVATEFCRPGALLVPGLVTGMLPDGVCDVAGQPAAMYRFTMGADGAVALTPSRGFRPRIEVRTSLSEPGVSFEATAAVPDVEWLLPAGQYLFAISAIAGSGAYSVRAASVPGDSGTTARAIVAGGKYTGQSLSLTDREFGDGTVYDYFMMHSTWPCTITMRSASFDAFLWVEDAINQEFAVYDDNGGGGTDARIPLPACNVGGNPIGIFANSTIGPGRTARVGPHTLVISLGTALSGTRLEASHALHAAPPVPRDLAGAVRLKRALQER